MLGGEACLVLLDEKGVTFSIPTDWTDYAASGPCASQGHSGVLLRAEDLIRLCELVAQWRGEWQP